MQSNKIQILSTRPIRASLVKKAAASGILIDEISFIETSPVRTSITQSQIRRVAHQPATVIFTSMNAVEAVTSQLDGMKPDWRIYCVGNSTSELVKKYFGAISIQGITNDAVQLANLITVKKDNSPVIFFSGNLRREELPGILKNHNIPLKEIRVYETTLVPRKIVKEYDGILFFSPSAVDSFFSSNFLPGQTILFAIGNTTAASIKKFCKNRIIVSNIPGKENLATMMLGFFADQSQSKS